MFLDRQNQQNKKGDISRNKLQIQCSPHPNPNTILSRPQKINIQLHMEKRKPQDSQMILYKKGTSEKITISYFNLYYISTVMKTGIGIKTNMWNNGIKLKTLILIHTLLNT